MKERSVTAGFADERRRFFGRDLDNEERVRGLPSELDWPEYLSRLVGRASSNLLDAGKRGEKQRSTKTWLLRRTLETPRTTSSEVLLERRIARADVRWANQVNIASGLTDPSADGHRNIDLVRYDDVSCHLDFVELKVKSNNAFYAAVELLEYICVYVACRRHRDALTLHDRDVMRARSLRGIVLAPAAYYLEKDVLEPLRLHAPQVREGLRGVANSAGGLSLEFAFERFPATFIWEPAKTDESELRRAFESREDILDL